MDTGGHNQQRDRSSMECGGMTKQENCGMGAAGILPVSGKKTARRRTREKKKRENLKKEQEHSN